MKTKYKFLLGIILTALPLTISAEKVDTTDIQKWYKEVENAKELKETKYSYDKQRVEDIELSVFKNAAGDVVKARFFVGGDHGSVDDVYYYRHGRLFFALRTEYSWKFSDKKDAKGNPKTIDTALQTRIYVTMGKIVKVLQKEVSSNDANAIKGLLAKAENKKVKANDKLNWMITQGHAAKFVSSMKELDVFQQLIMF